MRSKVEEEENEKDRLSHVEDEEFDEIGRDVVEDGVLHVDLGYHLTLGKAHHVVRGNNFVERILHKAKKKMNGTKRNKQN